MKIAKRIFLFVLTNILIIGTMSVIMSALGLQPYLDSKGINYQSLIVFCLLWGFGGAFISLLISRIMAKWMMGVKIIEPNTHNARERWLLDRVYQFSRRSGITQMPQVGIYEGDEINAFATGPSKNRALVAVSTGLLQRMNDIEIEGVLAHEVAHIANGDMVTMTLVQGVVNAFVMFVARVIGFFASQFVDEEKRPLVQFGIVFVLEILLGILGMMVVGYFSRIREYKADAGGASLAGKSSMIAALQRLRDNSLLHDTNDQPAIASLKISGKQNSFMKLFATHPDLEDRILKLQLKT